MLPASMTCYVCGQPAGQICTMCGRPFCPDHGGMRMYSEGANNRVVDRALCDEHTPNQWFLANRYLVIIPAFVLVVLIIYFGVIKPGDERRDREWDEKIKQQHREHEVFRKQAGFND